MRLYSLETASEYSGGGEGELPSHTWIRHCVWVGARVSGEDARTPNSRPGMAEPGFLVFGSPQPVRWGSPEPLTMPTGHTGGAYSMHLAAVAVRAVERQMELIGVATRAAGARDALADHERRR